MTGWVFLSVFVSKQPQGHGGGLKEIFHSSTFRGRFYKASSLPAYKKRCHGAFCVQGSIRFNVECGPMASPAFEPGRPGVWCDRLTPSHSIPTVPVGSLPLKL